LGIEHGINASKMNIIYSALKVFGLVTIVQFVSGCAEAPLSSHNTQTPQVVVPEAPKAPKLGLVLGGGAARGFAHIGVIQALEEAGIRPDLVVGTSAGSVVAALYASGKNGKALQKIAENMDEASFSDWRLPLFKPGMLKGEALARFVSNEVKGRQIQELAMPLGVVATDLHSGQGILFQRGDVATAVRASSAIPAVFQPVSIAGHEYVDGGLVSPVPVGYARQMGAELVVAVNISVDPESNQAQDTFQVLMQTFAIMGKRINAFELQGAEVVVRPAMAGLSSTSFASRLDAIQLGRQAMALQIPRLQSLLAAGQKRP
jgi:NTE family protein